METRLAVIQAQEEIEAEVNAVIKLILSDYEDLASMDPVLAADPVEFNRRRHAAIRKIWNLAKGCIRYGALSAERT